MYVSLFHNTLLLLHCLCWGVCVQAFTAYVAQMKMTGGPLAPQYAQYVLPFLAKVLSYHILLRRWVTCCCCATENTAYTVTTAAAARHCWVWATVLSETVRRSICSHQAKLLVYDLAYHAAQVSAFAAAAAAEISLHCCCWHTHCTHTQGVLLPVVSSGPLLHGIQEHQPVPSQGSWFFRLIDE